MPRLLLPTVLILLAGCGTRLTMTRDQVSLVAWYVEDLAHGLNRNDGELDAESTSVALQKVAAWLASRTDEKRQRHLPRQLEQRRQRWPALRALLREKVVLPEATGLVTLSTTADKSSDEVVLAQELITAENQDRRMLDLMVLSLTDADDRTARNYAETMRQARQTLDKQAP
jgi:DNA-binding protein YbaB